MSRLTMSSFVRAGFQPTTFRLVAWSVALLFGQEHAKPWATSVTVTSGGTAPSIISEMNRGAINASGANNRCAAGPCVSFCNLGEATRHSRLAKPLLLRSRNTQSCVPAADHGPFGVSLKNSL
jgi:hypothetical protein